MIIKNLCVLVLCTKIASALEGLRNLLGTTGIGYNVKRKYWMIDKVEEVGIQIEHKAYGIIHYFIGAPSIYRPYSSIIQHGKNNNCH